MDPTAPNNNGQNPPTSNPQTPIQPGQFVVAGEDSQPADSMAQSPAPSQPKVSLAGERQDQGMPTTPNAPASGASPQPDPTPFTPPGQQPQAPGQQGTAPAMPETPKAGGGSKSILIILAVVVLLAIIAAVAYFFVLPMLSKEETTGVVDEIIEETSPPPQRTDTDPGFGEIPESIAPADDPSQVPPETEAPPDESAVDPLTTPAQ